MKKSTTERFWSKVNIVEKECWEWQASLDYFGYGNFYADGKNCRAHRYSWTIHKGNIPKGLLVCHKCDNPKCINPDHLFLGTHLDNAFDMVEKGRALIHRKERLKKLREIGEMLS